MMAYPGSHPVRNSANTIGDTYGPTPMEINAKASKLTYNLGSHLLTGRGILLLQNFFTMARTVSLMYAITGMRGLVIVMEAAHETT